MHTLSLSLVLILLNVGSTDHTILTTREDQMEALNRDGSQKKLAGHHMNIPEQQFGRIPALPSCLYLHRRLTRCLIPLKIYKHYEAALSALH